MTNAYLIEPGNLFVEITQVHQRQVVTGIQSESAVPGGFGSLDERSDGGFAVGFVACSVRLRVKFYTVGTTLCGTLHHAWVGIHKDARTDAGLTEHLTDVRQEGTVLQRVPPVVAGQLVVAVGH